MSGPVHLIALGSARAGDADALAIATALDAAGIVVTARVSVDEDESSLERTLAGDGGLTVIVSAGGAAADLVRRVVARATGTRVVLSDRMLAALEERSRRHDRALPRRDERLALLPQGAAVWVTADAEPSWAVGTPHGAIAVLPRGDDHATRTIVEQHLVPFALAQLGPRAAAAGRTLKTTGAAIGDVEERLARWIGREGDVSVTMSAVDADVWITLRARGATAADAVAALGIVEREVAAALGLDCYGRDDEALEQVVGRLLRAHGIRLAVAESLTGGLLAHRLTNVPGASDFFERGVVAYSDLAKTEMLAVPESLLRTHGAVSGQTAEAMARGICAIACTPCGLSITGRADGTVYVGAVLREHVWSRRFRFAGGRVSVAWQSSQMALDMLRRRFGEV